VLSFNENTPEERPGTAEAATGTISALYGTFCTFTAFAKETTTNQTRNMTAISRTALALCLLAGYTVPAQLSYTISGSVKDTEAKPADAATVALIKAADSALVKMTLADEQGRYVLEEIPAGVYRLWVTMVGYQDYKSDTFSLTDRSINWPDIGLRHAGSTLEEVKISGRKAFIERKADRTVVNVDALIANAGSTALEVLERSPGIRVDEDGNISMKGKQGVVVYIDDKPTYMSGTDLQHYLRSLPSSALEQLELMPNPPARYDAAGSAGVINIRTRKNRASGFNGNLNLGYTQGKYARSNNSLNLSFRKGRFNLSANLGYNRQNGFNDLDIFRRYKNSDESTRSYFVQNTYIRTKGNGYSGRLALDFYQDEKTTWGLQLNGQLRDGTQTNDNVSIVQNAAQQTDSVIRALNTEKERFRTGGINLNYRRRFNGEGHTLTADLNYIRYKTNSDQVFDNAGYGSDGNLTARDQLTGRLPAVIDIYAAQADYTRPLTGEYVFSAGAKSSYIKTDNLAEYFYTKDNVTSPDYDKSNNFVYKEHISAAYLNLNKDFGKLSVQAGLRLEHTSSDGHQLGNLQKPDSLFTRTYTSLFPTLYLSYKPDSAASSQFNLNYGRRINRPYYQDLNPFISPLDKFTYYVGNPFLKPAFTHSLELSYTYRNKITAALSYARTRDEVNETIEMAGNTYYSRPGNIGRTTAMSLSLNATLEPFPWLSLNGYTEVANIHSRSDFYTGLLDTRGTFWFVQPQAQARLGKGWVAELSGRYNTDITNAQFVSGATGGINAALQKSVGKSATVRLSMNDIFYTTVNKGTIYNLALTDASYYNKFDTRMATLSFSYRFGKAIADERRHHSTGAEAEKGRVKS